MKVVTPTCLKQKIWCNQGEFYCDEKFCHTNPRNLLKVTESHRARISRVSTVRLRFSFRHFSRFEALGLRNSAALAPTIGDRKWIQEVHTSSHHMETRAHHGDEIPERDVTYHLMVTYLPLNYDTPALTLTPVLRNIYEVTRTYLMDVGLRKALSYLVIIHSPCFYNKLFSCL